MLKLPGLQFQRKNLKVISDEIVISTLVLNGHFFYLLPSLFFTLLHWSYFFNNSIEMDFLGWAADCSFLQVNDKLPILLLSPSYH